MEGARVRNATSATALALALSLSCGGISKEKRTGHGANANPDSGAAEEGIVLFDSVADELGVVSDHDGNALVSWNTDDGQVHFASWIASEDRWIRPAPLLLDRARIVDKYGSGHPILIGCQIDPASGEFSTMFVRRFDPRAQEWGPGQPTGISGSGDPSLNLDTDGAGNVYAYWWNDDGQTATFTFWPVNGGMWEPTEILFDASRIVGARQEGAWLLEESSGFRVRAFDLGARRWGDQVEFESSAVDIHTVAVGPSGEAMAVMLRHEPTEFVMEVQRYDPELTTWQPMETALRVTTDGDPNHSYGPRLTLTDFLHHDVVAILVPVGEEFEVHVSRREPATGIWSPLHTLVGPKTYYAEFRADESGNLYGYAPPDTLFHYGADTNAWTETPSEDGSFDFAVSRRGAFALGVTLGRLVAYRHSGVDGEWRSARGLPENIRVDTAAYGPSAVAPIGDDRALAVWLTRESESSGSVRAAFIE